MDNACQQLYLIDKRVNVEDDLEATLASFIRNPPRIHAQSTERRFSGNTNDEPLMCHAVGSEVARFILEKCSSDSITIEIGCGLSTIAFALSGSNHTVVTPNYQEFELLQELFHRNNIQYKRINWVAECSETYLPRMAFDAVDFVFIDGKHAFPWPIMDWFFTAERLRRGGVMVIDDTYLFPADILYDFMNEDDRWRLIRRFGKRAAAFQKLNESIRDVEWNMQPYVWTRYRRRFSWWRRALHRLRTMGRQTARHFSWRG